MLRAIIVLPLYLLAMHFLPQTAAYQRFADLVSGPNQKLLWHLIAYGLGLGLGVVIGLAIEFKILPRAYRFQVFWRVVRMALLGVVLASAYQLFQFFTGGQLSIFILLMPIIFPVTEIVYETIEWGLDILRRRRMRRRSKAALAAYEQADRPVFRGLGVHPSSYYLSRFREDISVLAAAEDERAKLPGEALAVIDDGEIEFEIYFPVEDGAVPRRFVVMAASALSQIVEMDAWAREETPSPCVLSYVKVADWGVELRYLSTPVHHEWAAEFELDQEGVWTLRSRFAADGSPPAGA